MVVENRCDRGGRRSDSNEDSEKYLSVLLSILEFVLTLFANTSNTSSSANGVMAVIPSRCTAIRGSANTSDTQYVIGWESIKPT